MITGIVADLSTNWHQLLNGLITSLELTGLSLLIGLPFALLLAIMGLSENRATQWCSIILVEIGRGVPLLVVLQFVYYGLPSAGLTLGSMAAAVAGLAWMTGVYTSEIIRGGLLSVPAHQDEAAQAMGLTRRDALRYIIIPQGIRVALPPIVGFSIIVFQSTSLAFTIALPELMAAGYAIGSNTFQYTDVFLLLAIIYGIIVMPASYWVKRWENRLSARVA